MAIMYALITIQAMIALATSKYQAFAIMMANATTTATFQEY
jgi:hypothetical protein